MISHFQPTGQQLTINDLRVLMKELKDVRAEWYNIGVQLGVSVGTLKAIKNQCLNVPFDCLEETLTEWLKTCLSPPTWTNVVDALSVVSEARLAAELKHKYCQNTSDLSLTSDVNSTTLLPQPMSKAAGSATAPTIHLACSQPPQLTSDPISSTPVSLDLSSETGPQHPLSLAMAMTSSPQYTEQQHPSPSLISDHHTPSPDAEVPSTIQLATVTTPPHHTVQEEHTGMISGNKRTCYCMTMGIKHDSDHLSAKVVCWSYSNAYLLMHAAIMTPGNIVVSVYDVTECIHDVYTCIIAHAT